MKYLVENSLDTVVGGTLFTGIVDLENPGGNVVMSWELENGNVIDGPLNNGDQIFTYDACALYFDHTDSNGFGVQIGQGPKSWTVTEQDGALDVRTFMNNSFCAC